MSVLSVCPLVTAVWMCSEHDPSPSWRLKPGFFDTEPFLVTVFLSAVWISSFCFLFASHDRLLKGLNPPDSFFFRRFWRSLQLLAVMLPLKWKRRHLLLYVDAKYCGNNYYRLSYFSNHVFIIHLYFK